MLTEQGRSELIGAGLDRVADAIMNTARPAVRITSQPHDGLATIGASRFGGDPDLPVDTVWPTKDGRSLFFLAQISLADIAGILPNSSLPPTGYLWFFYDADQQPWGFDPKDRGGWAVLFAQSLASELSPRSGQAQSFKRSPLKFRCALTLPDDFAKRHFDVRFTDAETKLLNDRAPDSKSESVFQRWGHHLLGWPFPIQADSMEEECAAASNDGYVGDPEGWKRAKECGSLRNAKEWKLLLQLDSDEDGPGWMWGDSGMIYFWIKEEDLRNRQFENVWLVLQCY